MTESTIEQEQKAAQQDTGPKVVTKTVILEDGSYGQKTVMLDETTKKSENDESYLQLRNALITSEDDFLQSSLSVTLSKLTVKAKKNLSMSYKAMSVDTILIICAMLKQR